MQRICRLICKICRICKQICNKICTKYDIKYATNMQNMQKNMQNMSYQKTFQVYPKICKICNEYAKYVSQNLICRICTPHFADDVCRFRRVAIAASRARPHAARATRQAAHATCGGCLRRAAHVCAAPGASRSQRAEHAPVPLVRRDVPSPRF